MRRLVVGGAPMNPVPERRVDTCHDEALLDRLRHLIKPSEILVVAFPLSGEQRVEAMVKIVAPLGINP